MEGNTSSGTGLPTILLVIHEEANWALELLNEAQNKLSVVEAHFHASKWPKTDPLSFQGLRAYLRMCSAGDRLNTKLEEAFSAMESAKIALEKTLRLRKDQQKTLFRSESAD